MTLKVLIGLCALLSILSFIIGMQVTNGSGSADERVGGSIFILVAAGFLGLTFLFMVAKVIVG